MAIKKYRVAYGFHYMPNPAFKVNPATGSPTSDEPSHIAVQEGQIIELDEERASSFTRRHFGHTPKLIEVSDSAGIPEINTNAGAEATTTRSSPAPASAPAPQAAPQPAQRPVVVPPR